MISLMRITRTYPMLLQDMKNHYSEPKGFVGRNICYAIQLNGWYIGGIVGGSSVKNLAGRDAFFNKHLGKGWWHKEQIVNNIFYHINKPASGYPLRNFTSYVLSEFRQRIKRDWQSQYGDAVLGFESLVELPRSGELYKKDGFILVGQTKGFTCKRTGGIGTDSWTGKRVWDTENLRPKLVLCRTAK